MDEHRLLLTVVAKDHLHLLQTCMSIYIADIVDCGVTTLVRNTCNSALNVEL